MSRRIPKFWKENDLVFNSIDYLLFFPIVALLNLMIPKRFRYVLLCTASIVFYSVSDRHSLPVVIGECAFIYVTCLIEDKLRNMGVGFFELPVFMVIRVAILLSLLIGYKYFLKVAFPLGMSFFTLQAIAYVIDVYKGKTEAEKNPLKMLLYIMFFAIVSSGPIERTGNLLRQIREGSDVNINRIKKGLLELAWGLYMKLVLSNRIAPMVNVIYDGYEGFRGVEIVIATILFGIQIYCDFAGYSYMAIGSARILGYDLVDNFDAPYLSTSPGQFWRRWHMSLHNWLREYIYFPLGGNRKGLIRKYINVVIVFIVSGMWHGNKLGFIFWGTLNGMFVIVQDIFLLKSSTGMDITQKAPHRTESDISVKTESILNRKKAPAGRTKTIIKSVFATIGTFILVDYAWIFFKADSFRQGLKMTKTIVMNPGLGVVAADDLIMELGTQWFDIIVLIVGITLLFAFDWLKSRYKDVSMIIFTKPTAVRWVVYLALLTIIIVFGIYGYSYEQTEFIYFQF